MKCRMMVVFSLYTLALTGVCMAQLQNYTEGGDQIKCSEGYFVRTEFPTGIIGFEVKENEKLEYNGALLSALSKYLKMQLTMVTQEKIDDIKSCESEVVIAKIESYHTRPARMDQRYGTIKITFHFFDPASSEKPYKSETIIAEGDRHWGNSTPLENALIEAAEEICKM